MQQSSSYSSSMMDFNGPTAPNQTLGLNTGNFPSQYRPQIVRKAVPTRKPVAGTKIALPSPLITPLETTEKGAGENIAVPASPFGVPTPTIQPQPTDDLLVGWDSASDANGRVYYLNHATRQTTWTRPVETLAALPLGWEERSTPDGKIYFFNINTRASTWDRPCAEVEQRRSSVVSPGTFNRQGSISTLASGPASPGFSILSDTSSPITSGQTSPMVPVFQNPFSSSPLEQQPPSTSENFIPSPTIEWETSQHSTKSSRRRSQFSLPSISSSTSRKLHLNSLPSPHLPSNAPASLRQSVDFSIKTGKIAADYGKKGAKLVAKGAKNPNTRKTLAVGIKGFKIANGIVKAATGVSLGAEFLPDLDFLGDIGGGGDLPVDSICEGDFGDVADVADVDTFDGSGGEISVEATSSEAVGVESVSAQSFDITTTDYGVAVDSIGIETVEVETVEVSTVEVETVEVETVEVSTVEVSTVEVSTVEVSTVEVSTVEVSTVEVSTVEIDALDSEIVEVDTVEIQTVEVSTLEIDTFESGTTYTNTLEAGSLEFSTAETTNVTDYAVDPTVVETSATYIETAQVSTIEVDAVQLETTEVESLGLMTTQIESPQANTFQIEYYEMDTVQVDMLQSESVYTCTTDEYNLSCDNKVEELYAPQEVEYEAELDVSVVYIPETNDEDRRPQRQHPSLSNHSIHGRPSYPQHAHIHRKSPAIPPQLIPGYPGHSTVSHVNGIPNFPKQLSATDIPAPLRIRPLRKPAPITSVQEIIP